jgi:hypothetical protein
LSLNARSDILNTKETNSPSIRPNAEYFCSVWYGKHFSFTSALFSLPNSGNLVRISGSASAGGSFGYQLTSLVTVLIGYPHSLLCNRLAAM